MGQNFVANGVTLLDLIIKFPPDVSSGYWQMPCSEIVVTVNLPNMNRKLSMSATDTEIRSCSKKSMVDSLCLSYLNQITLNVDFNNTGITKVLGGLDIPESEEYG
jgi:hypothetical protein